jgi:Trk K+ transport system NAD-binding subunit
VSGEGAVLVCGLGTLGIECVRTLCGYGLAVRAVDDNADGLLHFPDVPVVRGDCRDAGVLRKAGLETCRAVLLVTGDSRANIEAAMTARRLKPSVRIVARAPEHGLSELMATFLGDFVSYEPSRLAAGALALAALKSEVIGQFHVEGRPVRVLRRDVGADDRLRGEPVGRILGHDTLVLDHEPAEGRPPSPGGQVFHRFDPERRIDAGDVVTLLAAEGAQPDRLTAVRPRREPRPSLLERLRALGRPIQVMLGAVTLVVLALGAAVVLFPLGEPTLSRADALFTALVLMTGGTYADLFPAFNHLSNGLRLMSVVLSLIGTLSVGLVYAWLTDRLMTWRLRLGPRRPPAPREGHVVVVGMGQLGRRAAALLDELRRPVTALVLESLQEHAVPRVPVVAGNGTEGSALAAANVPGARGVLAATPDDWTNLEIALHARRLNPGCGLVVRTKDVRFSENVAGIFPDLQVLCVPVIAARAFAAAALGNRVLDLFQVWGKTVYVVEFMVDPGDGLEGRLVAEAAEGYDAVPVWHQVPGRAARFCSPVDQAARLASGHRLVLLVTSNGLRDVERGNLRPPSVVLAVGARRGVLDPLPLASVLVRHLDWTLEAARALVARLPCPLPTALYPHQAQRLKAALEAAGATVETSVANGGGVCSGLSGHAPAGKDLR